MRLRTIAMTAAVMALAVTALGAPASATHGKGTIGIVNGIPGQRVDLCINGKEIKSRAPYGGRAFRSLPVGDKWIKIFKADPRKCKGKKLGKKHISLAHDADWTIVINKQFPKFVVFNNGKLGRIPPDGPDFGGAYIALRHAADLGNVDFLFTQQLPEAPIDPSAHPVWHEGDQYLIASAVPIAWRVRATRPHKTKTLAKSGFIHLKAGHRYEWYLLGTKAKNARFIVWTRAISGAFPS